MTREYKYIEKKVLEKVNKDNSSRLFNSLIAYAIKVDDVHVTIKCPLCFGYHLHGSCGGVSCSGHRSAHCFNGGYVIMPHPAIIDARSDQNKEKYPLEFHNPDEIFNLKLKIF